MTATKTAKKQRVDVTATKTAKRQSLKKPTVAVKTVKRLEFRTMIFSPEAAKAIRTPLFDHSSAKSMNEWDSGTTAVVGGFQRGRSQSKVNEIVKYINEGIIFPDSMLADIDGVFYFVDGQHRGAGHILAGVPFRALVVKMTMREACKHFLVHNSKVTRVLTAHMGNITPNQCGVKMRALAVKYGMENKAVHTLMTGIMSGASSHGPNLVDDNADIERAVMDRADAIIRLWSGGKLWSPAPVKGTPEYWFSHQGVLKALAILMRHKAMIAKEDGCSYGIEDMIDDLTIVRDETPWTSALHAGSQHSGKSHMHVLSMVSRYKEVIANARDREARARRHAASPIAKRRRAPLNVSEVVV